jgi:hypothetical protein
MTDRPSPLRVQVERVYTLTDRFQVELQVFEKSRVSVQQFVQPAPSTGSAGGDIEALAFLVLMEASKSAQDDLKSIMDGVKAINAAKSKLPDSRDPHGTLDVDAILQLMLTVYGVNLEAEFDAIRKDLDSTSELSEIESLRLQMAMDRMSKMMSTLSNLMKKMSDTSSGIVQNLK